MIRSINRWRKNGGKKSMVKERTSSESDSSDGQDAGQTAASSTGDSKKKSGCGCCLVKLFALLLMAVLGVFVVAFVWRFVSFNRLQTKLADYRTGDQIFSAEQLNELYAPAEGSAEATTLLASACGDLFSAEFKTLCGALPFVGEGETPRIDQEWEQLADAKTLIEQFERAALQLRQFGQLGGRAHFPIDFSKNTGLDSRSVQMMNQGFNFLRLDSEVHMREENSKLLAANIRTALLYSNTASDIPSLDQHMRLSYDYAALQLLQRSLYFVHFELSELNSFNELLDDRDYQEGLRRMLLNAKVTGHQFFVDPSGYFKTQIDSKSLEETPDALNNQQQVEVNLKYSPFAHEDHLAFLNAIDEYNQVLEVPWDKVSAKFAELKALHDERFSGRYAQYKYLFAAQLLPDFSAYAERIQPILVKRQMIYAALTVKRFEAGEKYLPTRFVELKPKYCDELPADPYSDGPFFFSSNDVVFSVYSVGPNGLDEEGRQTGTSDDIRITLPRNNFDGQGPIIVELDFD